MQKKHIFILIKILVFLVVCVLVGEELHRSWENIQQVRWTPNYFWLTLAGISYALAYIPSAIYWRYAMQSLGQKPGIYEAFRAYYIGHLGKYVPGKAMVLVIRTGLLNHERTKITVAGACVFLETMTMMAVGAFAAALTGVFLIRQFEHSFWLLFWVIGIMLGTALPILPPVFHFIAKKCRITLEGLKFKTLGVGWLLNILVWFMLGVCLWLTALGFGMKSESIVTELPVFILAMSFSMVLGFASMLPGGLVVRELAMAAALTPFFTLHPVTGIDPKVMAIAVVTVQRFISILSELAVSALLAWKPSTTYKNSVGKTTAIIFKQNE